MTRRIDGKMGMNTQLAHLGNDPRDFHGFDPRGGLFNPESGMPQDQRIHVARVLVVFRQQDDWTSGHWTNNH